MLQQVIEAEMETFLAAHAAPSAGGEPVHFTTSSPPGWCRIATPP
jgi:hypothetical protein